ncbi:D-alanyl-D-alanine carboxypeptidase family protein [Microbacterium sp. bgisy189]|uniref:D-alanyl-D-alanine carboxypeptidase family protein n=1 Tax=Microbacterium sp. bgisy189 TaxID=3413798 RepID=UPI003EBC9E38
MQHDRAPESGRVDDEVDALADFEVLIRDEHHYDRAGQVIAVAPPAADLAAPQSPQRPPRAPRAPVDPAVRRRRIRRAALGIGIPLVVLAAAAGGYVAWALNAPLPAPTGPAAVAPTAPVGFAADVSFPRSGSAAISVSGAEDYLATSGDQTWLASGGDDARPMASITKLITALVVLDAYPLEQNEDGPTIVFGPADRALYDYYYVRDATIAPMPRGTSMSQRDALATMLIPSASNYATALARWAFGSDAGFTRAARAWLDEHGLTDTRVVEATGIDPRNTSTPTDLLEVGRLASADPAIAAIVAMPSFEAADGTSLINTNDLLGVDGITGLKTGTLSGSGSNLLYSATMDVGTETPLQIVGVVLGGQSRGAVSAGVLDTLESIRGGFGTVALAQRGDTLTTYTTEWGDSVDVIISEDASLLVWGDTPIEVRLDAGEPTAWIDGEQVGSITWTAGPETITVPIEVDGTIDPPTDEWRLQHPQELLDAAR